MHFCSSYFTTCDDQVLWIIFLVFYFMCVSKRRNICSLCTLKFQLTCVCSVMAFHQNYSCGACFKGAILGETQGNSVLCLNDNKNCIGFCSYGQNDPKDFLKTEEIVREPCSGKDNAKIFTGMVSVGPAGRRVLRFQPWPGWMGSTGNFSCVLAGHRNWGEGHLCTPRPCHTWALFGFLSWRCEDEKKNPCGLGIFDLCRIILHQSCQGRMLPQDCTGLLGSFQCQFLYKGKKNTSSHTLRNQAGHWGHWKHDETSVLCWGHSGLWHREGTKNPTRMSWATAQEQNRVDELRKELGVVSKSSHWGNALPVWPQSSATSHEPCAVSRLLPRTLWIMTRAGNSVLFIPRLFKLRK